MVQQKQAKRKRDIKTKLMAAVCMLMVSAIMMISSTYAWFTLSTAPEVTGITTAVGANGNLEMALLPKDGSVNSITSEAGDGVKDIELKNVTWGNLVDLSDSTVYGLDQITLFPAELNLTGDGKVDVDGFILKTPTYGADGRLDTLNPNAVTGYYDKDHSSFSPNTDKGVRAVGTASGMTPRQLSYRNARSAANTAAAQAANKASASLNNNGSDIANIAIKHALAVEGSDTYTQTDIAALRTMVNDLKGTATEKGALGYIETAYMQYILAYAASAANTAGDVAWQAVETAVKAENATLDSVVNAIGEDKIPALMSGINAYKTAAAKVDVADNALKDLEDDGDNATFTWAQIQSAMTSLVDASKMKLNGKPVSEAKNNISDVVSSVLDEGGLKVQVASGAGVYADIADQSGNYSASIVIEEVSYQGTTLNNMKARMETVSEITPYLKAVGSAVETAGAPDGDSATTLPITDMYGYIIDLAFRTNAAESNLLLQVDAADRIYDNNTNEETMGHGSSMTFMATTTDFSNEQVKGLMDSITMVFFNPADGTIYCYGGLDTANAEVGADGVTAEIYLYNLVKGETTYTEAAYDATSGKDYYTKSTTKEDVYTAVAAGATYVAGTYYTKNADDEYVADANVTADNFSEKVAAGLYTYEEVTKDVYSKVTEAPAEGTKVYTASTASDSKQEITDDKIMALTQNQAQALSVLVYLDGTTVTNADVAATGSTSMTGTMNLQFASSANLIPMEYADLHIPGANAGDETP